MSWPGGCQRSSTNNPSPACTINLPSALDQTPGPRIGVAGSKIPAAVHSRIRNPAAPLGLQEGYPRADNDLHALDRASAYEARFYGLYQEVMGKPLAAATREEVAAARSRVHALIAERAPNVALVKTHNLLGKINGHRTINMKVSAGSIYIIRDPRDVMFNRGLRAMWSIR